MANRLKIGVDFHGVITANPNFFSTFTQEAVSRGWEIHVITGGPGQVVCKMLDDWKISYTTVFAILDFYAALNKVTYKKNNEFHIEDKLWNSAKALYCEENGINIHIDDSTIYKKWFSTPYCLYNAFDNKCRLDNGTEMDFSAGAAVALDEIGLTAKKV